MASKAQSSTGPVQQHAAPLGAPAITVRAVSWLAMDTPEARLAWDALAECAAEPNPFHESWYLLAALRAHDPGGSVKLLRVEADGDLAGILPLQSSRRYYRWPIPQLSGWAHANRSDERV